MTRLYVELAPSASDRSPYKRTLALQCDQCGATFTRRWVQGHDTDEHFCNNRRPADAMKPGGVLNAQLKQTCEENWFAENKMTLFRVTDQQLERNEIIL